METFSLTPNSKKKKRNSSPFERNRSYSVSNNRRSLVEASNVDNFTIRTKIFRSKSEELIRNFRRQSINSSSDDRDSVNLESNGISDSNNFLDLLNDDSFLNEKRNVDDFIHSDFPELTHRFSTVESNSDEDPNE